MTLVGGNDAEQWLYDLLADLAEDDSRSRAEKVAAIRAATESAYPGSPIDEGLLAKLVHDLVDAPGAVPRQDSVAYGILKPLVDEVHRAAGIWGMGLEAAPLFGTASLGEATGASIIGSDGSPLLIFDGGLMNYAYGVAVGLADDADGRELSAMAWLTGEAGHDVAGEVIGVLIAYVVAADPAAQRLRSTPKGRPWMVTDVMNAIEVFVIAHEYAHVLSARARGRGSNPSDPIEEELWCDQTAAQLQMVVQQKRGAELLDTYLASYVGLRLLMLVEVAWSPWGLDGAASHPGRDQRIAAMGRFLPLLASGGGMSERVEAAIEVFDAAFDALSTRVWTHMAAMKLQGIRAPDPEWVAEMAGKYP